MYCFWMVMLNTKSVVLIFWAFVFVLIIKVLYNIWTFSRILGLRIYWQRLLVDSDWVIHTNDKSVKNQKIKWHNLAITGEINLLEMSYLLMLSHLITKAQSRVPLYWNLFCIPVWKNTWNQRLLHAQFSEAKRQKANEAVTCSFFIINFPFFGQ